MSTNLNIRGTIKRIPPQKCMWLIVIEKTIASSYCWQSFFYKLLSHGIYLVSHQIVSCESNLVDLSEPKESGIIFVYYVNKKKCNALKIKENTIFLGAWMQMHTPKLTVVKCKQFFFQWKLKTWRFLTIELAAHKMVSSA